MEVHAVLPTKSRKTQNVREFFCKKDVGDMLNIRAIRKLILESNARDLYEREEYDHIEHTEHKKNILDIIDTITIISTSDSILLHLDWQKFDSRFSNRKNKNSNLNVDMLRIIMQTNLVDYLLNIPVFQGLSNTKLELLTRFCHYTIEKSGAVICREGDRGEEVFILLSGEVKVEAMASKRMVELFEEGILSPLEKAPSYLRNKNQQNENEIHKQKGSVNLKCDYDGQLQHANHPTGEKIMIQRRQTLLRACHNCRRERIEKMDFSSIHDKDENDDCDRIPMCRSRLDIPSPNHTVELARLKPGDYFGEISTFIELPRAATVTAMSNLLMVSISKKSFRNLYHCINPTMEKDIEAIVKRHTLHTLLQTKSPFLEVINADDSKRMADLSTIQTVQKGEIIFNEGDEAQNFYFVYSGQLSVIKTKAVKADDSNVTKKLRIGTLYSGDYFGEMALLNKTKRLATIMATTTTVLISITRENFHSCFQETPQLIAELIVRMKGIQVDLQALLNYSKSRAAFSEFLCDNEYFELKCYEAIEAYERTSTKESSSVDHLKDPSNFINLYIREGSSQFVDVESMNHRLIAAFEEENIIHWDLLTNFKDSLKNKMEEKLLPRFKASKLFETLRQRMRTYDEIDVQLLA